jgi:hypothetical protein
VNNLNSHTLKMNAVWESYAFNEHSKQTSNRNQGLPKMWTHFPGLVWIRYLVLHRFIMDFTICKIRLRYSLFIYGELKILEISWFLKDTSCFIRRYWNDSPMIKIIKTKLRIEPALDQQIKYFHLCINKFSKEKGKACHWAGTIGMFVGSTYNHICFYLYIALMSHNYFSFLHYF